MLKTERMNLEEAVACTVPVHSFESDHFSMDIIKSAIKDYENHRLGNYDVEFMLILNGKAVTKMITTPEFAASHEAATKLDAARYNYMGSIEIGIDTTVEIDVDYRDDRIQWLKCSLYYNFDKADCEIRAKINNINGLNLDELRRQACEDIQLRKALDILIERGVAVPSRFEAPGMPLHE